MGLWDRLTAPFRRRRDAPPPAAPAPAPPPPTGPDGELLPALPAKRPTRRDAAERGGTPAPGERWAIRAIRQIARRYDSIVNALSGLGGSNDKGTAGRPDRTRMPLDFTELTSLFRFNGYATRFVTILPEEATRKGWRIDDGTPNVALMEAEDKRLGIPGAVREATTWARLYGGAVILIVVDEDVPPELQDRPGDVLRTPLDWSRVRRVLNLVVMDPSEAQPFVYESDLRSPRFRHPRLWQVSPNANGVLAGGRIVHHTRILYFGGRKLPATIRLVNQGFDDSILEAVWDQVRNKTSIDQAGALIAQELKLNVVKIEGLASLSTSDQADLFEMRMKMLAKSKSLNNLVLIGDGETFESLSTPMSGYENLDANSRDALAAVSALPQTVWFGDTAGVLGGDAGATHRPLWANVVAAWQHDNLDDPLTYLYRGLYLSSEGVTHGVEPAKWKIVYLPLDELTEKAQADLELVQAQADATRVQAGILPPEHIARSRYGPAGYRTELLPYDPEAEDAAQLAAARQRQAELEAAGGNPGAGAGGGGQPQPSPAPTDEGTPHRDALPGERTAYIYAEPSDMAAWRAAQAAVEAVVPLQGYRPESGRLVRGHVTALFFGPVPERAAVPLAYQTGQQARLMLGSPLLVRGLELWPTEDGRTVVVLALDAPAMDAAHQGLAASCARWIAVDPPPGGYRAHATLGFVSGLTEEQRRGLQALAVPPSLGTVARVALSRGSEDVVSSSAAR